MILCCAKIHSDRALEKQCSVSTVSTGYMPLSILEGIQYIPRNMHTALALLCFVVVMYWLIYPYPSGLLHWHCGNLTIAPVPAKQPWWIWVNASCESIMNDYITTTKQSTTKPYADFLGYTVHDQAWASVWDLLMTIDSLPVYLISWCYNKSSAEVFRCDPVRIFFL